MIIIENEQGDKYLARDHWTKNPDDAKAFYDARDAREHMALYQIKGRPVAYDPDSKQISMDIRRHG